MKGTLNVWTGVYITHLSYIQKIDLQEEAQGTSCDLVWCPTNGIADLVAD